MGTGRCSAGQRQRRLTTGEELKLIAVRDRWAFEELVYSEKMVEWNWCSTKTVESRTEDLFECYEQQVIETIKTVQGMFSYLKACYGDAEAVLRELRALLARQKDRRKTLCIQSVKSVGTSRVLG